MKNRFPARDRLGRAIARRSRAGFSVVEVCVALVVIVVGVLGILGSVTAGTKLQEQTRDYGRASRAVQTVHEELRRGDLDDRVAALMAEPSFRNGPIELEVEFPEQTLVDLIGGPVPEGWRYRDADGDGAVELDPAATATTSLVPVTVVARWNGGEMRSSFLVTEP